MHRDVRQRALQRHLLIGLRNAEGSTIAELDADFKKVKEYVGPLFQKNENFDTATLGDERVAIQRFTRAADFLFYSSAVSIVVGGAAIVTSILW